MGKVQNAKRGLGAFISSEKGQRFFNFAYSIGAAVIIWGALFKILHLPGANTLLSVGMGTEVLMFILTAFDRPPKEYDWTKVYPQLKDKEEELEEMEELAQAQEVESAEDEAETAEFEVGAEAEVEAGAAAPVASAPSYNSHNSYPSHSSQPAVAQPAGAAQPTAGTAPAQPLPLSGEAMAQVQDFTAITQEYMQQMAIISEDLKRLHDTTEALNRVSEVLMASYNSISQNSGEISEASNGYVEQMTALHRNIAGLNTIYDLQLRSVSSQIDSIDRVNRGIKDIRDMYEKSAAQSVRYCEETEKMAHYMQQLNRVYEKMLHAMTVNMYPGAMPPAAPMSQPDNTQQD